MPTLTKKQGHRRAIKRKHTRRVRVGGVEPVVKRKFTEERRQDFIFNVQLNRVHNVKDMLNEDHTIDVNMTDDTNKFTALFWAARSGYDDMVRLLLSAGADPNMGGDGDNSDPPVCAAASNGHANVVALLAESGADMNKSDIDGWTPLMLATDEGREDVVRVLLEKGAHVDKSLPTGETPLYTATENGDTGIVRALIDAGADVNKESPEFAPPPIYIAAIRGYTDAVVLLLKAGAVIDDYDIFEEMIQDELNDNDAFSGEYDDVMNSLMIIKAARLYKETIGRRLGSYTGEIPKPLLCDSIYDPITMEHRNIADILKKNDEMIIMYNGQVGIVDKKRLYEEMMTNTSKLMYVCKESNEHFQQNDENIVADWNGKTLYFNMDTFGMFGVMVSVGDLKTAVGGKNNVLVIDTSADTEERRPVTSLEPFFGGNVVSARHCQEKDPIKIGTLQVVDRDGVAASMKSCAVQGGARKRTRRRGHRRRKSRRKS